MAAEDRQPTTIHEGATTSADVEDESATAKAKSAEDRKAAAALSKLDDSRADDDEAAAAAGAGKVDTEAVKNAMSALGSGGAGAGQATAPKKNVKVDAADVKLLVDELELSKPKATELLKAHDGDAVKALKAYLQPAF
ncbi:hypothetical protein VTJ04DRAFT_1577 [Mycothermus thermophilus]|uniref:uncharacterized protein n=1 Tax=Humicola insolens TaxID=85995 RepID=UPI00374444D3